jgi:hypothetical protein
MNKCRLQRLESRPGGNLKRRLSRDLNIRYSGHLHGCIDHLDMAEAHLGELLNGENRFGLLTNIANARYEIKKYLSPEKINNECGS